jgi:hypothetical protein
VKRELAAASCSLVPSSSDGSLLDHTLSVIVYLSFLAYVNSNKWSLDIYQQEIDQHHQQFNLTADGNVKALPVTEVIRLPDDPQFFEGDILCR